MNYPAEKIRVIPLGVRGNLRLKLAPLVEQPAIPVSFISGLAWYVVRTNINCEARAESGLKALGFDVYLPRAQKYVRHARRKTKVSRPLFGRYVFVGFDINRDSWFPICSTHGVEEILCVNDGVPARIPTPVINALQLAELRGEFNFTTDAAAFAIGSDVQVEEGPFAGFIGEIKNADDRDKVKVLLSIFNRPTITIVSASQLRSVDVSVSRK